MSEKRYLNTPERRQAHETFSVHPIQHAIDERLCMVAEDARNPSVPYSNKTQPFSAKELTTLCYQGNIALENRPEGDVYGAEVMVPCPQEGEWLHITDERFEPVRAEKVTTVLYGRLHNFVVRELPNGGDSTALCARVNIYDIEGSATPYLVPMAIEDSLLGVAIQDAPVPVMETTVVADIDGFAAMDPEKVVSEATEQGVLHAYLAQVKENILKDDFIDVDDALTKVRGIMEEGDSEGFDDISAAFNYHLQYCIHEKDAWYVAGGWMTEKIQLVGLEVSEDENRRVRAVLYLRDDENVIYAEETDPDEQRVLFRYRGENPEG